MKTASFQKSYQDKAFIGKKSNIKKNFPFIQVFLIILILATITGILFLSQELRKEKVTEKTKASEKQSCGINLDSRFINDGQLWFSVSPPNTPINLHSNAFICGDSKDTNEKQRCDDQITSFISGSRPIDYEADPTPLSSKKEFTINVPCNGSIQIDFWKVVDGNYQACTEHIYQTAPQCTIPTTVLTPTSIITPTVIVTVEPTTAPTIVPTSIPTSTATPYPTSSACLQKVPNIPQGVGIEIINNNQCKFSWNEVSNITGYQVSWGENPNGEGKPNTNLGKVLTYTFDCPDLITKTYYFKVRAINDCAEGSFSNIVHAGNWPTPTEILLANTTSTVGPTRPPVTPSIPSAGIAQFGFLLIPIGIIMMALIL